MIAIWASRGLGVPVVVSERNQPDRPGLGAVHRLARASLAGARAIVVQTNSIASWMKSRFHVPVHVVPNPLSVDVGEGRREEGDVRWVISLGRLTHQKGYDVLVKSFAAVAAKHPGWRLAIYGEGPDRRELERLRAESGYEDRIVLPGLVKDTAGIGQVEPLRPAVTLRGLPQCPSRGACLRPASHRHLMPWRHRRDPRQWRARHARASRRCGALTTALDAMLSTPDLRDAYAWKARGAVTGLDAAIIGRRWLELLAGLKV